MDNLDLFKDKDKDKGKGNESEQDIEKQLKNPDLQPSIEALDEDERNKLISVRSAPETIRIFNEVKDIYKEQYPTAKEALDALIRKGADVIARERAGTDIGDISKEVIAIRNLTRRICQIFEESVRSSSSEIRQVKDDASKEFAELNAKINEWRDRFELANKVRKEATEASKTATAMSATLEKRNKELELSVANDQFTIENLRKTNAGLLERINSVAQLEKELSDAIRLQRELGDNNRQLVGRNELLATRNKELSEQANTQREDYNHTVQDLRNKHAEEQGTLKSEMELIKNVHKGELDKLRATAAEELKQLRESLQGEYRQQIQDLRTDAKERLDEALRQAELTCEARIRAAVAEALASRHRASE